MANSSDPPVVRFAPSPNGFLHLGHAYSALKNHSFARRHGGRFLLRIEDIDLARCKQEFADAILEDLHWLGLRWEEPVRWQSAHAPDYAHALSRLCDQGLLYRCTCSRGDIRRAIAGRNDWPDDPDGTPLYPGTCRRHGSGTFAIGGPGEFALRLDMDKARAIATGGLAWREFAEGDIPLEVEAYAGKWGDVVLARKDIGTSYHIAVVIDDALQGVTDVIRGEDLYAATGVHRLLQALLDLPSPNYRHHRLILDEDGQKLAKSAMGKPIRAWRQEGATAAQIREMLGFAEI